MDTKTLGIKLFHNDVEMTTDVVPWNVMTWIDEGDGLRRYPFRLSPIGDGIILEEPLPNGESISHHVFKAGDKFTVEFIELPPGPDADGN